MQKLLTEFLLMYKSFPCLWNTKEVTYANKEAKEEAYDVLVEKYKEIQKDATKSDVKRKIEYMRSAYRRQHKKVLLSRLMADEFEEEYVPQLWYYNLLTFLNDVSDFTNLDASDIPDQPRKGVKATAIIKEAIPDSEGGPEPKRSKPSFSPTTTCIPQAPSSNDDDDDDSENDDEPTNNHVSSMFTSNIDSEAEAFGKTIGLQLKELELEQRNIAEKLISEAIFFARFNSLTINSRVVNDEVKKDC